MSVSTQFKFTKKQLDELPTPEKRTRYRDIAVSGLIIDLMPSGTKTFRVYKKIKGQKSPVNVTLGKYPSLSIENARKSAIDAISRLSVGVNPNEEQRESRKAQVTLEEVSIAYLSTKQLSEKTLKGYSSVINTYLPEYKAKPLINLTEDLVKKEHARLSKQSPAQADHAMRYIRALFNFAKYEYRGKDNRYIFDINPVQILSHHRLWNKVARKNTRITISQLKPWFEGIKTVRDHGDNFAMSVCDLIEMAVLTGLRRSELLSLKWHQVNLKERTYYVDKTKNGDPLELPITNRVCEILGNRQKFKDNLDFVFNADNEHGVIKEPKKVIAKVRELTGIDFTLHDLRRTFTTTAESQNVGPYMIKRLLNHRTRRDDVTAGYIVLTPEELRVPAQAIENRLLEHAGLLISSDPSSTSIDELLMTLTANQRQALFLKLRDEGQSNE